MSKVINVIQSVRGKVIKIENFIVGEHENHEDAAHQAERFFWKEAVNMGADEEDKSKLIMKGEFENLDYKIVIHYGNN
jgi:hypothetical protein